MPALCKRSYGQIPMPVALLTKFRLEKLKNNKDKMKSQKKFFSIPHSLSSLVILPK